MDFSLQNSGPFICEGGYSKYTEPPDYGPGRLITLYINHTLVILMYNYTPPFMTKFLSAILSYLPYTWNFSKYVNFTWISWLVELQ